MTKHTGISSHTRAFRGRSDDWITPKHIIDALGEFDLDPSTCIPQPWKTAKTCWTIEDDGFTRDWFGRVWLNPPYGPETRKWMAKLRDHDNGIALIFARTETAMFFESIWNNAHSILFIQGRLHFHYPDGTRASSNSGGPSVLIAYGENNTKALEESQIPGKLVRL